MNSLIDAAILAAKNAIIAAAITALPLLGVPIIRQAFTWGVSWVVSKIVPYLENWINDTITDAKINAEKEAYDKAKIELQAVLAEHIQDQRDVEDAQKAFDQRLADLVRFKP